MNKLLHDIRDELRQFLTGKTIDALIPPVVYIIANNFFSLKTSIILSMAVAVVIALFRLYKKENILYALGAD